MRPVLTVLFFGFLSFGQTPAPRPSSVPVYVAGSSSMPSQKIGVDDLIGIQVYDSPELTRNVAVGRDGTIRLPLLKKRIKAVGLYPQELEATIADGLKEDQILVDPVVTVSILEFRSRPISVVGAVKRPITFQAATHVTLLDAISRAEGLDDDAGPEILVSKQQPGEDGKPTMLVQRISVKQLIDAADQEVNLKLDGGEEIRVPEAGKVWVMGAVKKPGAFPIKDGADTSLMKMLAMAEGTAQYFSNIAFIYRKEGASGGKNELSIDLKKVLERKSPDVTLLANDVLYIPENYRRKSTMGALEKSLPLVAGISAALIYALTLR